jgi:uncharacterized protein (DUF697 family)
MKNANDDDMARSVRAPLARRDLGAGRLGTYSALGAAAGAVPLPWLPDAVARRIRGALAHDIAGRHGLSLTPEARKVLAEPSGVDGPRGFAGHALQFALGKVLSRVGPLGLLAPLRNAAQTFVLGHLLHRYLSGARDERSVRIDIDEARRLRRAMDQAILTAITTDVHAEADDAARPSEDLRDQATVLTDGLIIGAASLPSWVVRRLEAAFDEVLPRTTG